MITYYKSIGKIGIKIPKEYESLLLYKKNYSLTKRNS